LSVEDFEELKEILRHEFEEEEIDGEAEKPVTDLAAPEVTAKRESPDKISAADFAVEEARGVYQAAVTRYRAVLKVTDQEFEDVSENLANETAEVLQDGQSLYEYIVDTFDHEECVLNGIAERREEDEEPESGQAAGA
jgi:hypothetical protein